MKRRDFIKAGSLATACVCMGGINSCSMISGTSDVQSAPANALSFNDDSIIIDCSKLPNLEHAGFATKFHDEERDIKYILICPENGKHLAFLDKCTHFGRELNYDYPGKRLECSSFGHSNSHSKEKG